MVSCLGVVDALNTINTTLTTINTSLGTLNTSVQDVKTKLDDVKIGSYVNVRLMDDTGLIPLPATVVSGVPVTLVADSVTGERHVIVDSGTVSVGNVPHVVVDSGTTSISNTPHVIVDSGVLNCSVTNVPHIVVDSGSIGVNNVVHTIVDSGTVAISGTPTVIARQFVWGIVGKDWKPVRGMDHTFYQSLVNNTHYEWSDANTCSLISIHSGMSSTNTSYANALGSDAVGTNRYRSFVQADAM